MTKYYKVLDDDGTGIYSKVPWNLPQNGKPGRWMPYLEGDLTFCERGYHACTEEYLLDWLDSVIYELEFRGGVQTDTNKVMGRQARLLRRLNTWNETTARLLAADCAEHVLHIFEDQRPNDLQPRKAIEAARQFAHGAIDSSVLAAVKETLWATTRRPIGSAGELAARDAAGASVRIIAWDATRGAAWAATDSAATHAVKSVFGDSARSTAGDAARTAERLWQTDRLMTYLYPSDSDKGK